MKNRDLAPADDRPWHCVLDRQMRQVYLGREEAEARRLCGERCVLGTAKQMGDAMKRAAVAAAAPLKQRRFGGGAS